MGEHQRFNEAAHQLDASESQSSETEYAKIDRLTPEEVITWIRTKDITELKFEFFRRVDDLGIENNTEFRNAITGSLVRMVGDAPSVDDFERHHSLEIYEKYRHLPEVEKAVTEAAEQRVEQLKREYDQMGVKEMDYYDWALDFLEDNFLERD